MSRRVLAPTPKAADAMVGAAPTVSYADRLKASMLSVPPAKPSLAQPKTPSLGMIMEAQKVVDLTALVTALRLGEDIATKRPATRPEGYTSPTPKTGEWLRCVYGKTWYDVELYEYDRRVKEAAVAVFRGETCKDVKPRIKKELSWLLNAFNKNWWRVDNEEYERRRQLARKAVENGTDAKEFKRLRLIEETAHMNLGENNDKASSSTDPIKEEDTTDDEDDLVLYPSRKEGKRPIREY